MLQPSQGDGRELERTEKKKMMMIMVERSMIIDPIKGRGKTDIKP